MAAGLVGYDPARAGGVFTFGGTGTLLYGVKIGLEKACPDVGRTGLREPAVLVCSERAHYACLTVANWLGLGEENVVQIPTTDDNEMRVVPARDRGCARLVADGRTHRRIVATMGTTDAFGLDDLAAIVRVRDELVARSSRSTTRRTSTPTPSSAGPGASSTTTTSTRTRSGSAHRTRAGARRHGAAHPAPRPGRLDRHRLPQDRLRAVHLQPGPAEGRPTTSQLTSRAATRTRRTCSSRAHHPGKYTLETTRSGSGPMAALANLRLFGKDGLRALLGHLVTMAETAARASRRARGDDGPQRRQLRPGDAVPRLSRRRRHVRGPAAGAAPTPRIARRCWTHNDYNRRIFELVQAEALQGRGVVISLTDCYRETDYGEPIVALKSYILSPFSDDQHVDGGTGVDLEGAARAGGRLNGRARGAVRTVYLGGIYRQ